MNESAQTYHPRFLQERRETQSKQIFRRRVGILAVAAALAIPVSAAGGARPFAHDVVDFVKDRAAMVSDAFSHPGAAPETPLQRHIDEQKAAIAAGHVQLGH